jgi:hypothetical protein
MMNRNLTSSFLMCFLATVAVVSGVLNGVLLTYGNVSSFGHAVATAVMAPPTVVETDHVRGQSNAPVTIIEYSDFQCPFSGALHQSMIQLSRYKCKVGVSALPASIHSSGSSSEGGGSRVCRRTRKILGIFGPPVQLTTRVPLS